MGSCLTMVAVYWLLSSRPPPSNWTDPTSFQPLRLQPLMALTIATRVTVTMMSYSSMTSGAPWGALSLFLSPIAQSSFRVVLPSDRVKDCEALHLPGNPCGHFLLRMRPSHRAEKTAQRCHVGHPSGGSRAHLDWPQEFPLFGHAIDG